MDEQELIKYFEDRRGDTSTWSDEPVKAKVGGGGSVVFSLRLAPPELEDLRRQAEELGQTVSDVIRSAILYSQINPPRVTTQTIMELFTQRMGSPEIGEILGLGGQSRGGKASALGGPVLDTSADWIRRESLTEAGSH